MPAPRKSSTPHWPAVGTGRTCDGSRDEARSMSTPRRLVVEPAYGRAVTGRLRAPGDKSISHRALLIGARAEGRSRIRGLSGGDDVRHTLGAVVSLGAGAEKGTGPEGATAELYIDGGADHLSEPGAVIDVGNSGTGIRLLAGFVATIDG